MHSLSSGTWFIHILTVFEWSIAIILILRISKKSLDHKNIILLAFAMLPNLASAMAAVTWHIFDNDTTLYSLVYIQALLTFLGNTSLAIASWQIVRRERNYLKEI